MDRTFEQELEEQQKYEYRKKQRKSNLEFHQPQNRPDETAFRNLDASLKKNISFVKKLKTISYEQKDTIWQEAAALKSDKYISEIVTSLLEAKLTRQADFVAVIEVGQAERDR
jgi:hypothetical protein